jgi:hypothetical protein
MKISKAAQIVKDFEGASLGRKIAAIETGLEGKDKSETETFFEQNGLDDNLLEAAGQIKSLAAQINVVIHAAGILSALPHILEDGEIVEYVSLGAGNIGKEFDLETDRRVAEFKFISWKGGAESIRQNTLFKDFYHLAAKVTTKRKYLYLLGLDEPLKFMNGGRNLMSVLSKNSAFKELFLQQHGSKYKVVRDYYKAHSTLVEIVDLSPVLPKLCSVEFG